MNKYEYCGEGGLHCGDVTCKQCSVADCASVGIFVEDDTTTDPTIGNRLILEQEEERADDDEYQMAYEARFEVKARFTTCNDWVEATRILACRTELLDAILEANATAEVSDGMPTIEEWLDVVRIAKEVRL